MVSFIIDVIFETKIYRLSNWQNKREVVWCGDENYKCGKKSQTALIFLR